MHRLTFRSSALALLALTTAALIAAPAVTHATEASQKQNFGPANDDFADAETLVSDLYLIPGDLKYSTRELKEQKITAASIGRSIWYKYKATTTGRAVLFITKRYQVAPFQAAVYSGTALTNLKRLGAVQVVGTDTDYSGSVGFDAVKDTVYYIQVDLAPRTYDFVGTFLIGVQSVATTGNLAAFANQPLTFQEGDFDRDRKVYVANGHKGTVNVTYGLSNLNTNISVATSKTTLTANQTTEFKFDDENADFTGGSLHSGSLDLIAKATTNSSILGGYSVPLRILTTEYTNKPDIEVRFVDPKPGAPVSGRAQSIVYVRNKGATTALGCRFDTPDYDYNSLVSLQSREFLPAGGYGHLNPIFNLGPNSSRKFVVSGRIAAENYYHYAKLLCTNHYGTVRDVDSAYFQPFPYYGIYPNLKVEPVADNVFGDVKLADFGTKRVYVNVTNTGDYSGYFSIRAEDDTSYDRAVITSMCVVNSANVCIGPASTDTVEFDMAKGEKRRIAIDVRRGNSTDPGEIQLTAHATDYSPYSSDVVGYGAFTLKK